MDKFIILFISLLFFNCSRDNKDTAAPEYPVISVMQKDTIIHKEYVSQIMAQRNVELRARVQGYLDMILIDEGQVVKAGQVLFQINDEEYKESLSEAKANLISLQAEAESEQLEVDRLKVLVEKQVLSETELKRAISELAAANGRIESAKSAVSKASIRLSHTSIRAPFDGRMGRLPFKMGSLINEGTLLSTESDDQNVYAYFKVSETEYLDYQKKVKRGDDGQEDDLSLVMADGTLHTYKGKIEIIAGEFESGTGTIAFRAKFQNPEGLLRHGSTGKVRLGLEQKQAVIVPQKSTFEIQDKTYVYAVGKDSIVRMKGFVPRIRYTKFYIVETGLQPGERIVYEGAQNLKDGMKISPKNVNAEDSGPRIEGSVKSSATNK